MTVAVCVERRASLFERGCRFRGNMCATIADLSPRDWLEPPSEFAPALRIDFRPHAGLLTETRAFIATFCGTFADSPVVVHRLTITAHELLENAIKYSSDGATRIHIAVHRRGATARQISIGPENRASPERLAAACEMIERIRAASDPFEFYCELTRASVGRNTNSGLGLARIRAETSCDLDCAVTEDWLGICARSALDDGGAL
jgi:hypothetical protein